jgi:hypothetical protein
MKFCEHCVYGKVHHLSLLQASTKLEYCDYVHNAVWGATKVTIRVVPGTLLHLLAIILGMIGFTFSSVGKQWLKTIS